MTRTRFVLATLVLSSAFSATVARAQEAGRLNGASSADIERVRTLYGSAAYEEALAAIPEPSTPLKIEVEQYRALCLLALGREPEAVTVVERLVRGNPLYLPPYTDTSPRMQAIFSAARARLLPDLARRAYADAKAAYELKNREAANVSFQRTLDLIASLPEQDRAPLSDLRLLAGEFLQLTAARATIAPVDPLPPVPAAAKTIANEYIPPVAIREVMPAWIPPDSAARRTEYLGLLRVQIGTDGRVTSATIVRGSHPAYDMAVSAAARTTWQYKPATRGGQPVASVKDIQLRLVPQ